MKSSAFSAWFTRGISHSVQYLSDVKKLKRAAGSTGTSLEMHQTRHIGRDHILGLCNVHELQLVVTHSGGNSLFGSSEGTSEPTALIVTIKFDDLDTAYALQQSLGLVKNWIVNPLTHRSHANAANR